MTAAGEDSTTVPVGMLSEFAFCPRAFHFRYTEALLAENFFTVDGKRAHRRVDRLDHVLPEPKKEPAEQPASAGEEQKGDEPPRISRSVSLFSAELAALFEAEGRKRRPPPDPVNALLSFGYALLAKECSVALMAVGLDPWWGLYHQPRHGRPALALDLMEEFRPLIVDSAVLAAINTQMLGRGDFVIGRNGCILKDTGRKAFIHAYEARCDQIVTHPRLGYRVSWRVMIRLQARLLSRWLRGDLPAYDGVTTR
ncbi:MAG: CRISPR-associated endonuclease Cas1 [Planctomycetota bacterium]|nr:CRISPR-associated endonuclease Cas1 [Planctomycetota bacterium]